MSRFREIIDSMYKRNRGLDSGLDPHLPTHAIIELIATKACQRAIAISRGYPHCYISFRARLMGRSLLRIGHGSAIAAGALLDARSRGGITLGDSVTVDERAVLRASGVMRSLGEGIVIGDRVAIGLANFLHGGGGVFIGNDCMLGPNVMIFSENHIFADRTNPIRSQGETRSPVVLEQDVWVGAGAVVLSGVTVGRGSVVAAGSVVTRDVPPWTIVAGTPAVAIGVRGTND